MIRLVTLVATLLAAAAVTAYSLHSQPDQRIVISSSHPEAGQDLIHQHHADEGEHSVQRLHRRDQSVHKAVLSQLPVELLQSGFDQETDVFSHHRLQKQALSRHGRYKRHSRKHKGRKHRGHKHKGHKRKGHKHKGRKHKGHKHKGHKHKGSKHRGHNHYGHRYHGSKHHEHREPAHEDQSHYDWTDYYPLGYSSGHEDHRRYDWRDYGSLGHGSEQEQHQGRGRKKRTLRKIWRKIGKFGKGIKSLLHPPHRTGPLPGFPDDDAVPTSGYWDPAHVDPSGYWDPDRVDPKGYWDPAHVDPTSGYWDPDRVDPSASHPRNPDWPGWYDSQDEAITWPKPTTTTTTTSTTPSTTSTTTPSTTTPTTPTTPATITTTDGGGGGGILVISIPPRTVDGRATCRSGFSYHEASHTCHEHCPTGAAYRAALAGCYCERSDYAVNFFTWRCAPAGGGMQQG